MATPATSADLTSFFEEIEELSPLSCLRQYPHRKLNSNNEPSLSLRNRYAPTAKSVENLLISELTSFNISNVEAMVELANNAFASLEWLHADYSYLYSVVREYISFCFLYSEAKKFLKGMQTDVSHSENFCARLKEAGEALNKADAELSNAMKGFSSLRAWMGENSDLLETFLGENTQVKSKVDFLRDKCNSCADSFKLVKPKAAELEFTKQVEESREIVKRMKSISDEAEACVEQTIKHLLTFWKK